MAPRQEVLNVLLAEILCEYGLLGCAEKYIKTKSSNAKMPDLLIDFGGIRIAIEAEFSSTAKAWKKAFDKSLLRVEQGISHVGVAIVYPGELRKGYVDVVSLKERLRDSLLEFCVTTEVDTSSVQLELYGNSSLLPKFVKGKVGDLVEGLKRSYRNLVEDDTLNKVVGLLEDGINNVVSAVDFQPATYGRIPIKFKLNR